MSAEAHSSEPPANGSGWWCRPGGGGEVMRVATPLVVSSLSWTILTFVDRMLLYHWSGPAMAAAFVGGVIWWALICAPLGVCTYVGTFVSQYHGSGQPSRIGPAVWQGVWIAAGSTPLVLAPALLAEPLFAAAGHSAEAVELESTYFAILCLASPAMLVSSALSCFWSGRGKTVLVMVVDGLFAVLNGLLDWWWIFGLSVSFGGESVQVLPAWGVAGAAWATVVSFWLKSAAYLVLMLLPANRLEFGSACWRYNHALMRRVLWFGTPAGVQMLLDILGFTAFVLIVGRLGETQHEATSMTFSIGHLAFMPVVGFGMAASILVGQYLGQNREADAARATWTSLQIGWGYMAVISAAFVLVPGLFLAGFFRGESVEGDAAQRAAVAASAATLLRFVAAYNLLDAMFIVFVSALKGAGDTRFILYTSLVMSTLLATLTWLAVEKFGAGLYTCWGLVACWVGALGVLFMLRFLQGRWRTMRVIEPALANTPAAA